MKCALTILLATAALAVAQGDISSEFQNAPQQPVRPPSQPAQPQPAPLQPAQPQPAPLQPAQPQPAPPQPASGSAPAKNGAQSSSNTGGSSFLGKDVPFFDPGSNIATWDGKNWNINNNTIFEARFEKYLNAPAAVTPPENEYQALLQQIMEKLSPGRITPRSTDEAFQLLAKASRYQEDANLSDSIANQVYSSWLARKNNDRLNAAGKTLEDERKRLEWNARITAEGNKLESSGSGKSKEGATANDEQRQQQQLKSRNANAAHPHEACGDHRADESQSAQARSGGTPGKN